MDKKKKWENINVYTSMFMVHFVIKYISANTRLLSTF